MSVSVAWIDGHWGHPDILNLPLSDRGLQLADGLFETILILEGQPILLEEHLRRWASSAMQLGMAAPPIQQDLEPLIDEAITRSSMHLSSGALRLNWSRGSSQHRGIGLSPSNKHRFWLTLQPHNPLFHPITTITSRLERRNCNSLVNRCKTFAYISSIQARREAHQAGADDALLLNTQTELCCGTAANLFVRRHGIWLTPPLNSGCLPGVMRARGLSEGIVKEANLGTTLEPDDEPLLINSLNCHPIRMHDKKPTKDFRDAKELWDKLTRRSS